MKSTKAEIIAILDSCNESFFFPMLDNGYVYLAATRLTLFRSARDWAMTIEVFGFSPRSGSPDIHIYTFGSNLVGRKLPRDYVSQNAYEQYMANNPYNESRFIYPMDDCWIEAEIASKSAGELLLRDRKIPIPTRKELLGMKIDLQDPDNIMVFEVCRYLAATHRELVLATECELRGNVPSELTQILQLNEWNHPDVVDSNCRPGNSETFQQLADVLVTGEVSYYDPPLPPNTDWRNWPEGGSL